MIPHDDILKNIILLREDFTIFNKRNAFAVILNI